jgi:hypothetical protein
LIIWLTGGSARPMAAKSIPEILDPIAGERTGESARISAGGAWGRRAPPQTPPNPAGSDLLGSKF